MMNAFLMQEGNWQRFFQNPVREVESHLKRLADEHGYQWRKRRTPRGSRWLMGNCVMIIEQRGPYTVATFIQNGPEPIWWGGLYHWLGHPYLDQIEVPAEIDEEEARREAEALFEGGNESSGVPKWWPKNSATKIKWKADLRILRPLLKKHGNKIAPVAKEARMSRRRVSRILQWAERDSEAHT